MSNSRKKIRVVAVDGNLDIHDGHIRAVALSRDSKINNCEIIGVKGNLVATGTVTVSAGGSFNPSLFKNPPVTVSQTQESKKMSIEDDGAVYYSGVIEKEFSVNKASSHPIKEILLLIHDTQQLPSFPHLQFNLIFKDPVLSAKCRSIFDKNHIEMMEFTAIKVFRFSDYSELKRAFELLAVNKILSNKDVENYLKDMDKFLVGRNLISQTQFVHGI